MGQFKGICTPARWLVSAALGLMVPPAALAQGGSPQSAPARSGTLDCLPLVQPLQQIPEIAAQRTGNVLRGTILLGNEKQRIVFREPTGFGNSPGKPGLFFVCREQTVR